ncbi:40686_t:CDS:2, partial [Gigaspora margarita]
LKYTFANVEITDDILNEEKHTPSFHYKESSNNDSNKSDFEISKTLTNNHQIDSNKVTSTNSLNNLLQNAQNEPVMTGLLAFLLDLHLKTLSSWNEKTQEEAKAELTHQFELLIATNLEQTMASTSETSKNSYI